MTCIKWIDNDKLPPLNHQFIFRAISGEILYKGSIDKLFRWVSKGAFPVDGFELTDISVSSVHPIYIIGTDKVNKLKDLVNLIDDWSNPELIINVVFVPGIFYDREIVSYHKWYMHNGLALAYKCINNNLQYAISDSIPNNWKKTHNNVWFPSYYY
jgi:hypothetical protein